MDHQWTSQPPSPEKSCELYIRDHPSRAIAIVSPTHALILRYSASASDTGPNGSYTSLPATNRAAVARCMVEFAPMTETLLRDFRPLTHRPVYGTLGLIAVNNEVFLSVITHATRTATVRPGETVEKIVSVAFYCLSSDEYDDVVPLESYEIEPSDASSTYSSQSYGQSLSHRDVVVEHPCHELRKILSNGSFYYSTDFDVTNRLQDRPINADSFHIDSFNDMYLWNSFMISPLVKFRSRLLPQEREALDESRILTSAIRGFCKTMTIPQSASPRKGNSGRASYLTLISRLSCRRAGTRFNARGIDDDGHVANFVESETIFWSATGTVFSYVQIRGSIPVFWEQAADLIPGRQKLTITRPPDATQPAFNKHFEELETMYSAVHIVNLLSETKPGEVELSNAYKTGIKYCPLSRLRQGGGIDDHAMLRQTHYDFHAETKGPGGYEAAREIRRYIEHSIDGFAYFLAEEADDDKHLRSKDTRMIVVLQQEGVFRTNCLDCLDRTNLIQTLISQMAAEAFLGHRGVYAASDFWMRHSTLWADNGDSLSKIYAGTGALKSSFTRHGKMSLAGAVADMRKSVQRLYHNNFVDPSRQITIDMLLGRLIGQAPVHLFDPISDFISAELSKRSDEYTSFENINLWVGTFNLNGKTEGIGQDLSPWLFPPEVSEELPDIYVVAFQEILELSPQQIMNSDPSRKYLWEQAVKNALNERQDRMGGELYVLLRSGQLVGAALCIFVKASSLPNIKNVEGSVKKTGMSGMAGNKGAVAIRLDYANTHICFVTAHLAAGFANYDERNRDYATIHQGLRFQRNRGIDDHDAIIWLGDFNYRVGLGSEITRTLVQQRNLPKLYENDQLNLQMVAGLVFPFYSEARINFMPTYKFDVGTDTYDSSEKARIPAWTDRILRRGQNLRQLSYNSAPLRFSDHRPVYGTFACTVSIVDERRREAISGELYERRKAELGSGGSGSVLGDLDTEEEEEEDLIGFEPVEPGLPAASSDRQKWWLEGGRQTARAQVAVPTGRDGLPMRLNPQRPSNPFFNAGNDEPEWVSVSAPGADSSSLSSSPFEKVPMMPGTVSTPSPSRRPVPSAPDAASRLPAQIGRLAMADDQGSVLPRRSTDSERRQQQQQQHQPPPPPPPRRRTAGQQQVPSTPTPMASSLPPRPESAASQQSLAREGRGSVSSGSGKPPIVKKPAHLAGSSPVTGRSPTQQTQQQPPLPPRGEVSRKAVPPRGESLI
ncbi:endonuclease/Exonuclease/phosphatase [Cordyceps fumosorosea ARSEF 2679]|uniref:phosphoinositide 5-phosphatase n=1 Tax=Cordyceps fumosorosea (strain ARSEF 2679) TaxID=1081104 RepID=A0A162MPS0_CORFA|nr:endonuclease/Exonuclease/phosphatase [Cordyceps fumosorosea ARSEF 2679]OAA65010.1 endonuclease/Exonuclease/phosphatase [Cordyceps fumosorosea ARSEF 2679]